MRTPLIVSIFLTALLCMHCSSPKLTGISFSKVEVSGPESDLVTDLVRHCLIEEGARLDVEKAPALVIHTHVEYRKGRTDAVLLTAETSTGVAAVGSKVGHHTGTASLHELVSASAHDLVISLGKEAKKIKPERAIF